ncbi:hypothetical protein L6164_026555 [Bauhinia variegata]|uniref:Uncharacterized protein n=1 Tax=Bauhinia variegata TaxID=167791 RepID=A0ACB9LQI8_BAUVA|nr:hypothetical protein L6164_026555 [Bauhinia variegata]
MEIFEDTRYYGVSFGRVRGYGEIFKCLDQTTGNYVAVKKIVDYTGDIDVPSTKIRAVALLKELNHDNIIRLLDILNLKDGVHIVLEYFDLDLYKFIYSRSIPKDQLQIENIHQQILSAVAYCHSNKIVHGDLRLENFLIDLDHSSYIVKLANFESARSLEGLPVGYGCQKMLNLELNQRISAEDTLEHYYFGSAKKDVKPAIENDPTEIKGSINGCHQRNESKNKCGITEKAMKSRKDPHHKDEYNFDAGRREDIVYLPDNGSENMAKSSPTVKPSHDTNYADENNTQSQTLKQTVEPIDDPDGTDVDSWPVELSTEPPADLHHKDECDLDSRRGEGHAESPVDTNNGSEINLRSSPREQSMDPSFVTYHTDENYVESGTMENLVSPVSNTHNQDGRIQSRPTEENEGKSAEIPEILEKKAAENLIFDPRHKDESDLNSRREHIFAPSNDPDTVTEDNQMRDPTEPSRVSHHADEDGVQPGTEEHLVKPHGSFEIQDTSDLNSRREHLVVPPDDPDCVSEHPLEPSNEGWHFVQPLDVPPEDNLRSGPTEEPLKPSHGSHDVDKDEVQSG